GGPAGGLERAAADRRGGHRARCAAEHGTGGSERDTIDEHQLQQVAPRSAAPERVFHHGIVGTGPTRDRVAHVIPLLVAWRAASLQSAGHGVANLASASTASARAAMEVKWWSGLVNSAGS